MSEKIYKCKKCGTTKLTVIERSDCGECADRLCYHESINKCQNEACDHFDLDCIGPEDCVCFDMAEGDCKNGNPMCNAGCWLIKCDCGELVEFIPKVDL